mgnify:FL=1
MQISKQVGHRLGLDFKARHWRCIAADDLVDKGRVAKPFGDAHQLRTHKPLTGQAVTTSAIDPEQLAAMIGCTLQSQALAQVGIGLCIPQEPKHQHHACRSSQND